MLFNSSVFAVFLVVVLVAHWSLTGRRARNLLLLGASYLFYGWWSWRFLALLVASSTVDYIAGIKIDGSATDRARRGWLTMSCVVNLGTLLFFKYFNFFVDSLRETFGAIGVHLSWPVLHIIVPVGVSFYTFQAMTYTIDVYRRRMPVCRDYPDFLLFVAYFPQLVSGPISRARQLLPKLQAQRRFDPALAARAIPYIVLGYVLKTVVADNLADVTHALANVREHSGLELLLVAYSAGYEIYGDFAGYSYIAIGISMLFGVQLPQNFRSPYLSQSIREFWTRWHISLTSWFREYLYTSLPGSRTSRVRSRVNIMITFVLSGLWHGANWTSITWGAANGLGYFLPVPFSRRRKLGVVANTFITAHLTVFALMVRRSPTVHDGFVAVSRMFTSFLPTAGEPGLSAVWNAYGWRFLMMVSVMTFEVIQRRAPDLPQIYRWPAPARYAFYATMATLYFYRGNFERIPFIYYQF